ncbi:MAG: hypothetical protein ABL958_10980 [Bdellovibrionia bacterium]
MKIDAFGTIFEVIREDGHWSIFVLGEGKKRRVTDIVIPEDTVEADVPRFIADQLHERATPQNPDVKLIK